MTLTEVLLHPIYPYFFEVSVHTYMVTSICIGAIIGWVLAVALVLAENINNTFCVFFRELMIATILAPVLGAMSLAVLALLTMIIWVFVPVLALIIFLIGVIAPVLLYFLIHYFRKK